MVEQRSFHQIILSKRTVVMKHNGLLCTLIIVSIVCGIGAKQTSEKKIEGLEQGVAIEKHSGLLLHIRSANAGNGDVLENGDDRTSGKEENQEQGKSENQSSGEILQVNSTTASTAKKTTIGQDLSLSEGKEKISDVKTAESKDSKQISGDKPSLNVKGEESEKANAESNKNSNKITSSNIRAGQDPSMSEVKEKIGDGKTSEDKGSKEISVKETLNIKDGKNGNANAETNMNSKNVTSANTKEPTATKTTASMEGPMHDGAFLRGFYVFVGIGVIVIIFFVVKGLRLRQHRAARRYKVLPYRDDQEMFPLAADDDDDDDEEIFNAIPRN
ncbi:uncharacterized protein LOC143039919 [Oratosquilla oratoria]|uniref:uncharacterized protein LOC143039919 n=1 Tax=Oratosquilla oratoria TaxID=337810 RepID=UPI003F776023